MEVDREVDFADHGVAALGMYNDDGTGGVCPLIGKDDGRRKGLGSRGVEKASCVGLCGRGTFSKDVVFMDF